jgi:hypothetical protein
MHPIASRATTARIRDGRCSSWRRDPSNRRRAAPDSTKCGRTTRHDGDRYHGAQKKKSGGGRRSNAAGNGTRHKHVAKNMSRAPQRQTRKSLANDPFERPNAKLPADCTRTARGSVRHRTNRLPSRCERW